MSKNEKDTEKKGQNQEQAEKYVTKYDRKMKMREEQKKKEKKEEVTGRIIGGVIVAALVCLVAYFPIRNYQTVNSTYIKVNGENVSKVEFDYYYNAAKNSFINQYGSYLSLFGLDTSRDLSTQMYSDTLTWKDYFEEMAVNNIKTQKALKTEGKKNGFSYDVSKDYKEFKTTIEIAAQNNDMTLKKYVQAVYGPYATVGRIKSVVEDGFYASAYQKHVSDEKAPGDDEITSYYEENKADYDSVDYYMTTIDAELPTEPTELADATVDDGTEDEEQAYQPSEAEQEKAMADARELADAAEATVASEGELQENILSTQAPYVTTDWLFDESRKEGDTTIIEDSSNFRYYVLSFVKRYRNDEPSADVRIILAGDDNGQAILEEWKSGEKTEESFAALADQYNEGTALAGQGGLSEGLTNDDTDDALIAWIFEAERKAGDAAFISTADGYNYVVYYVGTNKAKWMLDIKDSLLSETMSAYLEEICDAIEVEDPKGNLNYLKVQAEEEAAAEAEAAVEEDTSDVTVETETVSDSDAE